MTPKLDDIAALLGAAVLLGLWLLPTRAQQADQPKALTADQYQSIILDLCDGARYANHIRYDAACESLAKTFATQKAQAAAEKPKEFGEPDPPPDLARGSAR